MRNSPNDPLETQSLQQQSEHYKLAMLYYGFFVVATAGIVLALYHCLIIKWCAENQSTWPGTGGSAPARTSGGRKPVDLAAIATSYKYSKGKEGEGCEECVVCLSMFEEGEDVRELPRCKHSFHTPCIDRWLSSHLDCPLCRALVAGEPESSGGRLSDSSIPV